MTNPANRRRSARALAVAEPHLQRLTLRVGLGLAVLVSLVAGIVRASG